MKEGVEALGRVRAQAMVLLVIAFLAGAFVGGTMERVMVRPSRSGVPRDQRDPRDSRGGYSRGGPTANRGPRTPGALPTWYESLNLTVDQRAKIEAVLSKRSDRVNSAVEAACLIIRPARDSSRKESDAVLTAAQLAKRDSIFASFGTRGGGPRPAGGASRGGVFSCGPEATPATAKK
jgi:hypothetical protein